MAWCCSCYHNIYRLIYGESCFGRKFVSLPLLKAAAPAGSSGGLALMCEYCNSTLVLPWFGSVCIDKAAHSQRRPMHTQKQQGQAQLPILNPAHRILQHAHMETRLCQILSERRSYACTPIVLARRDLGGVASEPLAPVCLEHLKVEPWPKPTQNTQEHAQSCKLQAPQPSPTAPHS